MSPVSRHCRDGILLKSTLNDTVRKDYGSGNLLCLSESQQEMYLNSNLISLVVKDTRGKDFVSVYTCLYKSFLGLGLSGHVPHGGIP